jgi:hypothetical protein
MSVGLLRPADVWWVVQVCVPRVPGSNVAGSSVNSQLDDPPPSVELGSDCAHVPLVVDHPRHVGVRDDPHATITLRHRAPSLRSTRTVLRRGNAVDRFTRTLTRRTQSCRPLASPEDRRMPRMALRRAAPAVVPGRSPGPAAVLTTRARILGLPKPWIPVVSSAREPTAARADCGIVARSRRLTRALPLHQFEHLATATESPPTWSC